MCIVVTLLLELMPHSFGTGGERGGGGGGEGSGMEEVRRLGTARH